LRLYQVRELRRTCEGLAIVRVRMLWYRKSLRVCEELWFATVRFQKHLSLLFAMIFGSQNSPLLLKWMMWIIFGHPYIIEIIFNCLEKHQLRRSFSFSQCPWITSIINITPIWGRLLSRIHGLYWYYFLYQASVDLLTFERDLKSKWVPNMMAGPMQFVGMLTSLPMKS
jgi:hypothetical protein